MKKFQDKIVVITGASRGIGRATAIEFAKAGAHIIGVYIQRHEMANSLIKEVLALDRECTMLQADIADPEAVSSKIVSTLGPIDILINNAGIAFDGTFQSTTLEEWHRTFSVNVMGTFSCTQQLSKKIKAGGAIVNVASISGLHSFYPEWMAYDGSKAWIASITHSMAKTFAHQKIRVNAVAPGYVETDMTSDLSEEFLNKTLKQVYLNRMAQPIEIAKTILFLASDDASYVNGATLIADGGMH